MGSCEGWNAGNMASQNCSIDLWIVYAIADFYYAFIMFSSFALLLPVVAYTAIFIFISEPLGRWLMSKIDGK